MKTDILATVLSVIEKSGNALIGSVDEEGYPNLKAMLKPRKTEGGMKVFYLTTNTSSLRAKQYGRNPKAAMYFYHPQSFQGVMLKGKMVVCKDQETKNGIWNDGDETYYPKGKTDPDYCVLKFTSESGRLYRNFGSSDFKI